MSSSTRWTSRALVAAGAGGLLVLGAAFGAVDVSAASADDTPPTTAQPGPPAGDGRDRPGTLPGGPPTTVQPEAPARDGRDRPGTLPPAAEPVPALPNYAG